MEWTDQAVILSATRHSEHSFIIRILTGQRGLCAGMARDASSRTKRGVYQPGNQVRVVWKARIADQLGTATAELVTAFAAQVMQDAARLAALSAACAITEKALAEHHPEPELYRAFIALAAALAHMRDWPLAYIRYEAALLRACGYGLDLSRCALTGQPHNLAYVSPRTGRAVSEEAAAPYRERLLTLPDFICNEDGMKALHPTDIENGLKLTGYFLEKWVFSARGAQLPAARARLAALLNTEDNYAG